MFSKAVSISCASAKGASIRTMVHLQKQLPLQPLNTLPVKRKVLNTR